MLRFVRILYTYVVWTRYYCMHSNTGQSKLKTCDNIIIRSLDTAKCVGSPYVAFRLSYISDKQPNDIDCHPQHTYMHMPWQLPRQCDPLSVVGAQYTMWLYLIPICMTREALQLNLSETQAWSRRQPVYGHRQGTKKCVRQLSLALGGPCNQHLIR